MVLRRRGLFCIPLLLALIQLPRHAAAQRKPSTVSPFEDAHRLLRERQYDRAIELLNVLEKTSPAQPEARVLRAIANGMACQAQSRGAQHDPNVEALCGAAKGYFSAVLRLQPGDGLALNWMGALTYIDLSRLDGPERFSKLDEVRRYYTNLSREHPGDTEALYWLGVTAWLATYWTNIELREDYSRTSKTPLKFEEPLPDSVRRELVRRCGEMVTSGLGNLQKLLSRDGNDLYSMTYLNLLLRQAADLQEGSRARALDLTKADQLVSQLKKLETKGARMAPVPMLPERVPPPPPPPPDSSPG